MKYQSSNIPRKPLPPSPLERRPEGQWRSSGDQPDSEGVVRGAGRRNETLCVDVGRFDDALGSQKSEWRMAPTWEEQTQERPHDSTFLRD